MRIHYLIVILGITSGCGSDGGRVITLDTGSGGTADAASTDGSDGTTAQDGTDGSDGTSALDGADGSDGASSSDGSDGTDSSDGTDGADGADGADGTDGQTGSDGAGPTAGVYQTTVNATVTRQDATSSYVGKVGIKVREDGVFSGTGTASSDSLPAASLTVSGFIANGVAEGKVTWTRAAGGQSLPSVTFELTLDGTATGSQLDFTFKGGDQTEKVAGSLTGALSGQ